MKSGLKDSVLTPSTNPSELIPREVKMKRKLYHYPSNYKEKEEGIYPRFSGVHPRINPPLSIALLPVSAQQSPQWKTYRSTFAGALAVLPVADRSAGVK